MSNNLERVLRLMAEKSASDVYMSANTPILIKLHGQILQLSDQLLTQHQTRQLLSELLTPQQLEEIDETGELNIGRPLPRVGSFRLSAFKQRGTIAAVFRCIPYQIPTLDSLGVPEVLSQLVVEKRGLILMVGATGTGKTTSLAAMIDHRNTNTTGHIITLEDPIEVIHSCQRSLVNQREIGRHCRDFAQGLRSALRQDPDVIVIGELRDLETIRLALRAAETGHLVLATVHTRSAINSIEGLVEVFAAEEKQLVRAMLAESLRLVVAQVLVKRRGGGRVAAREVLVATPAVRNLIREGRAAQLQSVMQSGAAAGMKTMEGAMEALRAEGLIDAL